MVLDFILVHGYTINHDGTIDDILQSRLDLAVRLFKLGLAKNIIVAGKYSADDLKLYNKTGKPESAYMREYLEKEGIDSSVIIEEVKGTNTFDCAENAYDIIVRKEWKSGIVVSNSEHMERILKIDQKIFPHNFFLSYFSVPIKDPVKKAEFRKHEEESILYIIERDDSLSLKSNYIL